MNPRFYSRIAIGVCTLFLTTFFGAVLFAYNLRAAGKGKLAWPLVIGSLFWFPFIRTLFARISLDQTLLPLLVANVLGAIILVYPLWNNLLDDFREYEKRPVWKPVLIFLGICTALLLFQIGVTYRWFGEY